MRDCQLKGPAITSRFPVAFPLPTFASRPSDSRRGVGPSSRSAYRALPPGPRRGLPRFARTSYDRGGCLLCPEDGGALPGWAGFPADACRIAAASPYAPLQPPIGGADRNETSVGGLGSSPVRSASRLWPPDGTGALGLLPELRTPPGTPATHVRPRPGHEHGPGTTPSILVEPPINVFTHMRATSRRKPVRSSPRPWPPDGTGALGLSPELRTPPTKSRRRTSGWGQAIEHGPGTTRSTSHRSSLQSASSLNACDLASHRLKAVTPVVLLVRGKSDSPTEAGARATLENSARHAVGCCKIDSLREPPIGTMSVALSPGQSSTVTCVGGSVVTIAAQRRSESTRNLGSHPAGACCAQGTRDVTVRPR